MSKSSSPGISVAPAATEMPFEQALEKLETIVESMENEELPLETLLTRYEEGTTLAAVCQKKLAEAELKIQRLEKTASGEVALRPFRQGAAASEDSPTAE